MADIVLSELASVVQTEQGYKKSSVDDILVEALGMMGESPNDKQDFEEGLISTCNRLLTELYKANNAIRIINGKEPFTEYPVFTTAKDTVPLEYETISDAFVYGLAYWLLMRDDEYIKANAMLAQYNKFLEKPRATYRTVQSVF